MTIDRQVPRGVVVLPVFSHHITLFTGFSSIVESSVSSQKLRYQRKDICRGSFLSNQSVKKSRGSEHLTVHLEPEHV